MASSRSNPAAASAWPRTQPRPTNSSSRCTSHRCPGADPPRSQPQETHMSTSATRIRAGAAALAAAGLLFLAYPALRPWHDEGTVAGATASMSSTAWVTAHFFAMLGFILMPLGLLALRSALAA